MDSDYASVLQCTQETMAARARNYRKLVMFLGVLSGVTVLIIAVCWCLRPLPALLAAFPAVAFFFVHDDRLVGTWRQLVLRDWTDGRIDIGVFDDMLRGTPTMPPTSIEGMLGSLGLPAGSCPAHGCPRSVRTAFMDALTSAGRVQRLRLFALGLGSTVAVSSVLLVTLAGARVLAVGAAVLVVFATASRLVEKRALRRSGIRISDTLKGADANRVLALLDRAGPGTGAAPLVEIKEAIRQDRTRQKA